MLKSLLKEVKPLEDALYNHPIYSAIQSIEDLKIFMSHHVYCVWDFMCLVKTLQLHFAPVDKIWIPPQHPNLARFINEIVLGEESDLLPTGEPLSHFEMYLKAMEEVGLQSHEIKSFINNISMNPNQNKMEPVEIPSASKEFMTSNLDILTQGQLHQIAASFCFGRETIIPNMFQQILNEFNINESQAPLFHFYLKRHIEVDSEDHGPLALEIVKNLCGNSQQKWDEALFTAKNAIRNRIRLWDRVLVSIQSNDVEIDAQPGW